MGGDAMGFSYRKSVKMGPFRVTASKSGISYSAGVKGVRVTKRANGKVQTTLSAPGTGLRYTTSSRSRQPSWHATGHTITPDGREVDFRCDHNHRTESAAVECAGAIRKQIQRGQGQDLITRVRSTPASREVDRQRALQKEADHETKTAQRAQAAQQRAQDQQAHREARASRRAEAAQDRGTAVWQRIQQRQARPLRQDAAGQNALRPQTALQRGEGREQAAPQRAEEWSHLHRRNDERWERVNRRRRERSQQRRPRGWPVTGLIVASGTVVLGAIFAGLAGNKSHGALATTAGALITLGILAVLICGSAALWRRLRNRKWDQPREAIADRPNSRAPWQPSPSANPLGYDAGPYPSHTGAGYPSYNTPPARTGSVPPWET
jgi:hypothetical protein